MSATIFGRARLISSVMAVTVFSALVLVGCGKDDDGGKKNPAGPTGGGNLLLEENEAWVGTMEGYTMGFIFQPDNDLVMIVQVQGIWGGYVAGSWSTSGSNITLTINDPYGGGAATQTGTYNVSDNILKIGFDGDVRTFTKTGNITYMDISGLMKSPADKEQPLLKELKDWFNK